MRNIYKTESILINNDVNNGTEIVVWDAIMGQGKTQSIISYMLEKHKSNNVFSSNKEKFVYISPLLSEAHRLAGTYSDGEKQTPMLDDDDCVIYNEDLPQSKLRFCHPSNRNKDGSKKTGLLDLLESGANVVSTHQLFKDLTLIDFPYLDEYTLIIDEALDCFVPDLTLRSATVEQWLKTKILSLDEDGYTVRFNREHYGVQTEGVIDTTENTEVYEFAQLCDRGYIFKVNGALLRCFDFSLLSKFKKVIIMTYNYKGSVFDLMMQHNKLSVHIEYFGKKPQDFKHLININTNVKDNSVGDYGVYKGNKSKLKPTLTASHFKRERKSGELNVTLHNKLNNLWRKREKKDLNNCLWTCYKDDINKISKGKSTSHRFKKYWLAFNTKAINEYSHCTDVAYLVNPYCNPSIVKLVSSFGLTMKHEHYSLNTMLQFIFRSCVRREQEINLYVPSERMRDLLLRWLDGEEITYADGVEEEQEVLYKEEKYYPDFSHEYFDVCYGNNDDYVRDYF